MPSVARQFRFHWLLVGLLLVTALGGCASALKRADTDGESAISEQTDMANPDPWEAFNRGVTQFNDAVDELFAKPVAMVYTQYTPDLVRTSVSNFFFNLSSIPSAANNLLQGNVRASAEGAVRVGVNTVFGFGGLIDVASEMKLERHKADFGQTLGRWGVPPGPYLVVPLMGPSTLRDSLASALFPRDEVLLHIQDTTIRNRLILLRTVEQRSNLLRASSVLDEAALDKYSFVRDVFLQVRRNEVNGD